MCTSPLIRYRLKKDVDPDTVIGVSSQYKIKGLKQLQDYFGSYSAFKNYFDSNMEYQYIKCRKCDECKADYAQEWSIRCFHEFSMRKKGAFITLTVDDTRVKLFSDDEKVMQKYCKGCRNGNRYIKYPINYTLCKGLILDELKRMRDVLYKRYNIKIRYFGCGEYGSPENSERPHYHILIFGYDFPDKKQIDISKKGVPIFYSEELQSFWKYGLSTVQDVNHRACMYTAKYCMKKLKFCDDLSAQEYYYGREPEFLIMSKGNCQVNRCKYIDDIIKNCKGMKSLRSLDNPFCKNCHLTRGGIGFDWFQHYYRDVLKIGYVTIDSIKYPIPNYYLEILKLTNSEMYDNYKLTLLDRVDEIQEKHPEFKSVEYLERLKKINKNKLKHYHRQ